MSRRFRWIIGIGAMKAGTTTLHDDLGRATRAHLIEKESSFLTRPATFIAKELCRVDKDSSHIVDVSASYAMSPATKPPTAEAFRNAGADATIVYITRNPIARIQSHLKHDFARGIVHGDPNEIVFEDPRFLQYSMYRSQLAPWSKMFGDSQIVIVSFEDYIRNRQETIRRITTHASLPCFDDPNSGDGLSVGGKNRGHDNPVSPRSVARFMETDIGARLRSSRLAPIMRLASQAVTRTPTKGQLDLSPTTVASLRASIVDSGDDLAIQCLDFR